MTCHQLLRPLWTQYCCNTHTTPGRGGEGGGRGREGGGTGGEQREEGGKEGGRKVDVDSIQLNNQYNILQRCSFIRMILYTFDGVLYTFQSNCAEGLHFIYT